MSILQDLYSSEINVKVTSFWDGGWKGWLGDDEYNGLSEEVEAYTFAELEIELEKLALRLYPDSEFSRSR